MPIKGCRIRYKNIWKMLMYAYEEINIEDIAEISSEEFDTLDKFYEQVLTFSVQRIVNSYAFAQYRRNVKIDDKPAGKIDIEASLKCGCYANNKIVSKQSKLDIDNNVNRIIKLAIMTLADRLENKCRDLLGLAGIFNKVSDIDIEDACKIEVDTFSLSDIYKSAFFISKIILEETLITDENESGAIKRLCDCSQEKRMNRIFESFIRNYYANNYNKRGSKINRRELSTYNNGTILNEYVTDVTIDVGGNKVLIIDAKWYGSITRSRYGGTQKISSYNQMQIENYVHRTAIENKEKYEKVIGILAYAKPSDISMADIARFELESIANKGIWSNDGENVNNTICKCGLRVLDLTAEFNNITDKLDKIYKEFIE